MTTQGLPSLESGPKWPKFGSYADGRSIGIPFTVDAMRRIARCEYVEWRGWPAMFLVPMTRHGNRHLLCIDVNLVGRETPFLIPLVDYYIGPQMDMERGFALQQWPLRLTIRDRTEQGALARYTTAVMLLPGGYTIADVEDAFSLAFVRTTCPSTGKPVLLKVPPQMRTVREALAWGFDVKEYAPVQET